MTDTNTALRNPIATEAADWYARLRAQDVSELDAVRFRAWLNGDPQRRREFEAIDGFWEGLSAIEQSPEVLGARQRLAVRRRRIARPRAKTLWAIAATVLLATGVAFVLWRAHDAIRYVTDIGEQRVVPLADGSVITLNTASEIRLRYSNDLRGVELVRGQANFEVAKDSSRPFIVTAGNGSVRALGTVFDVYKANDRVTVTLIEGKVAVTPGDRPFTVAESGGAAPIVLAAGEQLSYARSDQAAVRAGANVARVSAWRSRKLDFSDTLLPEAIAEANRYSRDQIVLQAPNLADARISGTFEAGKSDVFVEGLQSYFGLRARRDADHRIVLTVSEKN